MNSLERVLYSVSFFNHFNFCGAADADNRDAAGKSRNSVLDASHTHMKSLFVPAQFLKLLFFLSTLFNVAASHQSQVVKFFNDVDGLRGLPR
jgi:hypothetical protein